MSIHIDALAHEIVKSLDGYTEQVVEGIQRERKTAAKKAVAALKETSSKKSGEYGSSWGQTEEEHRGQKSSTVIHNKKHYRLTHLLENGHYTRNGGWAAARPHIKAVEESVIEEFVEGVKGVIRNAGQ